MREGEEDRCATIRKLISVTLIGENSSSFNDVACSLCHDLCLSLDKLLVFPFLITNSQRFSGI